MRSILTFTQIILFLIPAFSQTLDFEQHIVIKKTDRTLGAKSIFAIDIDNDGDNDVLSASSFGEDRIAWYENLDGQADFGAQQTISLDAIGLNTVYAGDLDSDGDVDVLSSSFDDDKIAWYENTDGLGSFSSEIIISTTASGARDVFTTDLDGDGDIDVLSASSDDNKIAWYENTDGLASFTEHIITTTATNTSTVHSADLDGDGDMDVLSNSMGLSFMVWYENMDGLGNFSTAIFITDAANSVSDIFTSDLDGDGDLDLLSSSIADDKIAWYENMDGNGTFGEQQILTTNADGARAVYAADLDSDGDMDVCSASYQINEEIAWYENTDGLGNFGSKQTVTNDVWGATSVFASDLDGDGDLELLSASSLDHKIAWYENKDGMGDFSAQKPIYSMANRPSAVLPADIDGDGDFDLVTSTEGDGKISWHENLNGLGDFGPQRPIFMNSLAIKKVALGDLDGDGDIDIYYSQGWFENIDGLGNFSDQHIIFNSRKGNAAIADLDNDGDLDLIFTNQFSVNWSENLDGNGNFGPEKVVINSNVASKATHPVDIDGDGDIDILTSAGWVENQDGLGNFNPTLQLVPTLGNNISVYAADLDGDGDMDALSASKLLGQINRNFNTNGAGLFAQAVYVNAEQATSVFATDLDGDGDNDLLFTAEKNDLLIWRENEDGLGDFGPFMAITQDINSPQFVHSADINGDGHMDVLSASNIDMMIAWYENPGPDSTAIPLDLMFIVTPDTLACFGDSTGSIMVEVGGGNPGYTYTWDSISIMGNNPTNLPAGTYCLTVTDMTGTTITGCTDILAPTSPLEVTMTEFPANSNNMGGTATATVTGGTMPYTFAWDTDPVQNTETAIDLMNDNYNVIVTDANGCEITGTINVGLLDGLSELKNVSHFNLFPNPANGKVILELDLERPTNISIKLFNSLGQEVIHQSLSETTEIRERIDVVNLPRGMYFLSICSGGEALNRKLILD